LIRFLVSLAAAAAAMSFLRVHKSSVKTITLIDGDTREKRKVRVRANYPDQSFVEYLVALYHKQPDCIVLADGAALPPKPSLLFPRIHSGDKCVLLFVSGTRAGVRNKWEVRVSLTRLRETGSQNNAAAAAATTGSSKPTSQATPNAAVSPTATSNQAQEQVPQLTRSLSAAVCRWLSLSCSLSLALTRAHSRSLVRCCCSSTTFLPNGARCCSRQASTHPTCRPSHAATPSRPLSRVPFDRPSPRRCARSTATNVARVAGQ